MCSRCISPPTTSAFRPPSESIHGGCIWASETWGRIKVSVRLSARQRCRRALRLSLFLRSGYGQRFEINLPARAFSRLFDSLLKSQSFKRPLKLPCLFRRVVPYSAGDLVPCSALALDVIAVGIVKQTRPSIWAFNKTRGCFSGLNQTLNPFTPRGMSSVCMMWLWQST